MGTFIVTKNKKSPVNASFFLLAFSSFIWQLGNFFILMSTKQNLALFWVKFAFIGIALIPVTTYQLTVNFLKIRRKNFIIILSYLIIVILVIPLSWTKYFFSGVYLYPWGYWYKAGILHPFFLILFATYMFIIFYKLFKVYVKEQSTLERMREKYILIALAIAYMGAIDYLPTYGVKIYPFGFLAAIICTIIIGYVIYKYRLMDINVVLTRASIFIIVYAFILGIPFWVGFRFLSWGLWIFPVSLMAVLATAGPFIYGYLRRHAEEILLREQRRYQHALRELSKTMTRIRDLDQLLKTITSSIVDTVKVSFAAIYIREEDYKSYQLKHCSPAEEKTLFQEFISLEHSVVTMLSEQKRPLLSEEIGHQQGIRLDAGLVVPCFMEDHLIAFMVVGKKFGNHAYASDDVLVFETFSYSASLAIENCIYWHEIEDRQRQARLQEMDTYSYSLAHEIDNPMQVILGHATLLKGALSKANLTDAERKEFGESLDFILECQQRVSTMVEAIRDFGQKATGEHKPLNIEEVVESFSQLYSPQFKANSVVFQKTSQLKEPVFVLGEKPELMQVLVILANNALHAMTGLKEKKVSLNLELAHHDWVRICFLDNGYGIKPENLKIIFKPFVTSKASTEGTGMGLHNALRIVERHKGRIWAESEGQGKGATFFIEFPLAKDVKPEDLEDKEKSRRLF
jgi:K+-sensing histidine kinase KdpD